MIAFVGLSYPTVRNAILKLQHFTEDWRTKLLSDGTDTQYPGIAIVVIDPPTLAEFAPQAPAASIPRELNARIIRAIDAAHPRAIGLDFVPQFCCFMQQNVERVRGHFKETSGDELSNRRIPKSLTR